MENSITQKRVANVSLLEYANKSRDDGFFSDLTINVENESIAANRLVLACYSRFFEGMFKMPMRERYENVIEIKTVDGETMKTLINFIYTRSITITNENAMSLLSGADFLQLQDVKKVCFEFLQKNVTIDNALNILQAATLYRNPNLTDDMQQYICTNFDEVAQSYEFKALSKINLKSQINNLDFNQVKTTSVYQAILIWIRHDEENRKSEFPDLFMLLKLENFSMAFLEECILKEELVLNNFDCQKLALSAFRKQVMKGKTELQSSQGRVSFQASKLLILGGYDTNGKVTVAHDLLHETSVNYPRLPQPLVYHCSLNFHNYIYCFGGRPPAMPTNNVWRLNANKRDSIWKPIASMVEKRCLAGAAVYCDDLIVAGGYNDKDFHLVSSEFYQASLQIWKTIAPLNKRRSGLCLVASDKYLYALGGYNYNDKYLSSVERLSNLTAKSWDTIESMQMPRRWFAAVSHGSEIYVIGGKSGDDNSTILKSVEKYKSSTNQWKYVSDMKIERRGHAACVLQGKIYVVGGISKTYNTVKEIECYDPKNDEWTFVENDTYGVSSHSMVAL